MGVSRATIDLDSLGLRSGEAESLQAELRPEPPVLSGETLELDPELIDARIDVSHTTSGYALRLRAETTVGGTCARCLAAAARTLSVDAREVDQGGDGTEAAGEEDEGAGVESELRSPYVANGELDVLAWLRDALALELPERLLCREDCAGLCPVCGVSLNEVDPEQHRHEAPPDPRFAKLRELLD